MMKILHTAEKFIFLPIIIIVLLITNMALDNSPPGKPGKIISALVNDDNLFLSYEFERYRSCDVTVYRQMIHDGRVDTLMTAHVTKQQIDSMNSMTKNIVHQVLPKPFGNKEKPITLQVALDYSCNALQKFFPLRLEYSLQFIPIYK